MVFVQTHHYSITVTSPWVRLRLKSPASRLFTQPFIQAQIKETIKAPHHWSLWGDFTGDQWILHTNGQKRGKCFHLMTSPCRFADKTSGLSDKISISKKDEFRENSSRSTSDRSFMLGMLVVQEAVIVWWRRRMKKKNPRFWSFVRGIHR